MATPFNRPLYPVTRKSKLKTFSSNPNCLVSRTKIVSIEYHRPRKFSLIFIPSPQPTPRLGLLQNHYRYKQRWNRVRGSINSSPRMKKFTSIFYNKNCPQNVLIPNFEVNKKKQQNPHPLRDEIIKRQNFA